MIIKTSGVFEPEIEICKVPFSLLREGQMRLDAAYYSKAKADMRKLLEASGYELVPLEVLCEDIFNLPRFKRVYATDPADGWPYMTPGQLVMLRCYTTDRFISKRRAPKATPKHFVKKDWILVTCSGTVGRAVLATESLEKYFLTHDLIRIIPKAGVKPGYLVAYLSCKIGQTLIKEEYGSTIDHIEPSHVKPLLVPRLSEEIQANVDAMVREAYRLRDRANELLEEAERLIENAVVTKATCKA